jgi:hypothetical protein
MRAVLSLPFPPPDPETTRLPERSNAMLLTLSSCPRKQVIWPPRAFQMRTVPS